MLRTALRLGFGTATVLGGGWLLKAAHGAPAALGAGPLEIREVAAGSPNYRDGVFVNREPASPSSMDLEQQALLLRDVFIGRPGIKPPEHIPVDSPPAVIAAAAPLAVRWYGHSSAVIEIDGYRVLTDPSWSQRCSPSTAVGPQRLHPVPEPLEALPAIDAVVISHDHYDHLDVDTVTRLVRTQRAPFFVPLGVGAHLRKWGVPDARIVELDWGQSGTVGELTVVCTPARHFSGRFLSRNTTLWSSWVLRGPEHRAFFGGDTGYTEAFAEIGSEYGPFDLTLMPIGAYHKLWPDIHMDPEDAVRAHRDMTDAGAGLLVPIHWATFRLAPHPWGEPADWLVRAAEANSVTVAVPRPGQRVDAAEPDAIEPWWRG